MTNKYEVIPANINHVEHLHQRLTKETVQELWAVNRLLPRDALIEGLTKSYAPKVGMYNGLPVCMYGVIHLTLLSRIGIPWMLASDYFYNLVSQTKHARFFLKGSKEYIKQIKSENALLISYVDKRNKKSLKWLKWLGFEIGPEQFYGPDKLPFHVVFMVN